MKSIRSGSLIALLVLGLAGCGTPTTNGEADREVVLKYIGGNVGTLGPFRGKNQKELKALSAKDQSAAAALIDRGGAAFVVFGPDNSEGKHTSTGTDADLVNVDRIVVVLKGAIVGDFHAAP